MNTTLATARIVGIHHVGVPVRSMERSLAWYKEVFGLEPTAVIESEGEDTSRAVQLENARVTAAFLNVGNTVLELLEYRNPIGDDFKVDGGFRMRNCDVGCIHIALQVDDIASAHATLVEKGAEFSSPPAEIPDGELAGIKFAYFRDPDGVQFELFELPA
jgi:catechol 2,3-dioxygenase-like lactoylglutathione lyase family enzyme